MWLKHAKFVVKHVKLAPKTVLIDAAKRCSLDIRTEDSEDESQDLFYNTQMSIPPTSIASEKAFLAVGIVITKLGSKPFFYRLL